MPFVPSNYSFLFPVVRPEAPSSVLAANGLQPNSDSGVLKQSLHRRLRVARLVCWEQPLWRR